MLRSIFKGRNLWRGHFVICFVFWSGVFAYLPNSHASNGLEIEAQEFFSRYFEASRRYDVLKMIELVSRSNLASNLQTIVQSPDEDTIVRSALLVFNAEFIFGGYCRVHMLNVEKTESEVRARLWFERIIDRPGTGPMYEFFLVRESGELRLDRMVFSREKQLSNSTADIDLCDIPINWNNPALLKPGESAEEQQRRLGIP